MFRRAAASHWANGGPKSSIELNGVGRDFIASCYEIFLGRHIDDLSVADERGRWPLEEALPSITTSDEFVLNVYQPLHGSTALRTSHDRSGPSVRQRVWIIDTLPMALSTTSALAEAKDWAELLTALLSDSELCRMAGLPPLLNDFCDQSLSGPGQLPVNPNADLPLAELAEPPDVARAVALWRARTVGTDT